MKHSCLIEKETNKKKTLIQMKEEKVLGFTIKYELYESIYQNRSSYDLKVTKLFDNTIEEESYITAFEWRKNKAQNIFDQILKGKVTPMSLEECVLELI